MKIAFVIDRYPPRPHSSIGSFVQAIARALHGRGHAVTVIEVGDSTEETTDRGIRVVTLQRTRLRYAGNLVSRLRLRRWLTSHARAGEIDLIEAPDYAGFLPFGVKHSQVVIRLHQTATAARQHNHEKVARGFRFYERRNLAANPNWIGVSHHILDFTRATFGVSPKRSVVIYNPFFPPDTEPTDVPDLPSDYVLSVGEVCRRKGSIVLAQAARLLLPSRPTLHIVYVGGIFRENGRLVSEDIREVVGPDLAGRVHFLGRVNRATVLACMRCAKVFAFASQLEALGLVTLEAMYCGVPVVCMKAPPGPEIVEDEVTGLLADAASPEAFSNQIARLLDNRGLANALAVNAKRTLSDRFSFESCIEKTERFYQECLQKPLANNLL